MNNIHHSLQSLAINIDKLSFLEGNPRQGDIEAVAKSYKQFGQRKPIVATTDHVVIAGNHQLAAAKQLGWDEIAVVITDDDELTAKAFALADNRTAELGSYDDDLLADLLSEVSSVPELMDSTGFTEDDLFDLIGFDEIEEKEEVPEVPKDSKTQYGDRYKLGNHTLVCGDATLIEFYPDTAEVCITDPPYGVDYVGGTKDKLTIENDSLEEALGLLEDSFENIAATIKKNIFVFHPNMYHAEFLKEYKKYFHLSSVLMWVKNTFTLGRGDFHWKSEPILYGWVIKGQHNWYGDRKQSNVLEFNKPTKNKHHPTMKPIELIEYLLKLTTKVNDIVLDPFSGSGSTLIACENLKRSCYAIEYDPKYCDVIIERWENLTGKKAQLIEKDQDDS
ncbi:MAG: DNA modification methylase [Pelagibacterales bacterium]|nr:DNA modification methylase [Pelagibacterales bacterium]